MQLDTTLMTSKKVGVRFLYSYGPYGYGPYSYGVYSYGLGVEEGRGYPVAVPRHRRIPVITAFWVTIAPSADLVPSKRQPD